jgi:hypothetical protein
VFSTKFTLRLVEGLGETVGTESKGLLFKLRQYLGVSKLDTHSAKPYILGVRMVLGRVGQNLTVSKYLFIS